MTERCPCLRPRQSHPQHKACGGGGVSALDFSTLPTPCPLSHRQELCRASQELPGDEEGELSREGPKESPHLLQAPDLPGTQPPVTQPFRIREKPMKEAKICSASRRARAENSRESYRADLDTK